MELGDRFGIGIIYEDLLSDFLKKFDGSRKSISATKLCPACVQEKTTEENQCQLVIDFLEDPEFQAALKKAQPFCLDHSMKLLSLKKTKARREILLRTQHEKLQQIKLHLEEFIRKHDYRFQHQKITEEEAASCRRAMEYLVGPIQHLGMNPWFPNSL